MTTRIQVDDFLSCRRIALAGASRRGKKFGNAVLKTMRGQGYDVLPVHPEAREIDGVPCRASVRDLPDDVEAMVLVVPPRETERLVREAAERGIRRVWMQQGAESAEAVRYCEEHGIACVHGECVLMFAEPAGFVHRAHRWVRGVRGALPR